MNIHDILFWFFSIAMLLSGVLVITNRNPVTSAMFLVLLFGFMAGLFVLLEAFFLAAIQVLVYAGAVMVLFLFVIMLLDIKESSLRTFRVMSVVGGVIVAGGFVWELALILREPVKPLAPEGATFNAGIDEVVKPLFTKYMLPFELTALLLLAAMVGVVLLSRKETR
jgi:NADH-quinone oxidoreductase subunit J